MKTFRKSEIRKFVGSFRKFLCCASLQITNPKIVMIYLQIANPQIYTKYCTTLSQYGTKTGFLKIFVFILNKCELELYMLYSNCKEKKYVFGNLRKKSQKDWICKSHICRVPHFRKVRRSKELSEFASIGGTYLVTVPGSFSNHLKVTYSARDNCRHNHEDS